jgi:hypothetical protein
VFFPELLASIASGDGLKRRRQNNQAEMVNTIKSSDKARSEVKPMFPACIVHVVSPSLRKTIVDVCLKRSGNIVYGTAMIAWKADTKKWFRRCERLSNERETSNCFKKRKRGGQRALCHELTHPSRNVSAVLRFLISRNIS